MPLGFSDPGFVVAIGQFFSKSRKWHRQDRVRPLVRQHQLTLNAILRAHRGLAGCAVRCRRCGIRFLTHPRNAKRKDLCCEFGCRELRRRELANARSKKYYQTAQGWRNKKDHNGNRKAADSKGNQSPSPATALSDTALADGETSSSEPALTVEPASELPSPAGDPAAPVAPEEPHDENDEQKGTGVVSSPPTKRPPFPFFFQLRQVAAARVCSSLSGPTPALKVRTMSETVERSSLDLRFEGYRLRDEAAEARLLASISERGIEEPLGGVDTPQGRVLLDGFRRNRCAAKLGLECVPYVSWGTDETLGIASLWGNKRGRGSFPAHRRKDPRPLFIFRSPP